MSFSWNSNVSHSSSLSYVWVKVNGYIPWMTKKARDIALILMVCCVEVLLHSLGVYCLVWHNNSSIDIFAKLKLVYIVTWIIHISLLDYACPNAWLRMRKIHLLTEWLQAMRGFAQTYQLTLENLVITSAVCWLSNELLYLSIFDFTLSFCNSIQCYHRGDKA